MRHLAEKCNGFHSYPKIKNLNCSELWIPFVFLKKKFQESSNYKAIHECALLQFRNENLWILGSEITSYLAGTIIQFKISLKQNWPRMLLIEVTY